MGTLLESADGSLPAGHRIIEVRICQLKQLFNVIDPSPSHERDLDPNEAENNVVEDRDERELRERVVESPDAIVSSWDRAPHSAELYGEHRDRPAIKAFDR